MNRKRKLDKLKRPPKIKMFKREKSQFLKQIRYGRTSRLLARYHQE